MLKGLFYIFLGIMLACSCDSKSKKQNEQEANTPTNENDSNAIANIEFPQKSFNFGDLQEGEIVSHTFHFKNTGTKSLVIHNVEASCGCTTPKYDKKPIPPGGEGKIEVEMVATKMENGNPCLKLDNEVPPRYNPGNID